MITATAHSIDELFNEMTEAWNRHDMEAYTSLWTEDCDFVNVVGMHREGPKDLKAELDWLHADRFKNTTVHLDEKKIRFLTPEIAVAIVWWRMDGDPGIPQSPSADGHREGVFTHVLQLTPQGWRFAASQNTDKPNIPDPLKRR